MLRGLIVVVAMLSLPARASAGEVIAREGGYRFSCPDDWEVRKRGDRVFLFSRNGLLPWGFMKQDATFVSLDPAGDPEDIISLHLEHPSTPARAVIRSGGSGRDAVRVEFIQQWTVEGDDRQHVITCPRLHDAYVCVHLEYLADHPDPARHRRVYEEILSSLRPADPSGPTTPDWLSTPAPSREAP